MNRERLDQRALRREALVARAALQRLELAAVSHQLRTRSMAARGLGALALRAASGLAHARAEPGTMATRARPWMLSAGWLLLRGLRQSPTARWVMAGVALGGAVWWVARALRASDPAPDQASDDSG